MKRTILFLILLSAISIQVSAQFRQKEGDPIDYTRIRLPREPGSHPLTYTIYSEDFMVQIPMAFKGELIRTREIGPSLLEKAVQMALDRTGTTRAQIAKWNEQVKMAKDINYSMDDFIKDLGTMTGYGDAADLIRLLGGYTQPLDVFNDKTKLDALMKELLKQSSESAGFILDYMEKLEVFLKARERDKQKWDNRIANYAAEGLARFYKEANHCLRQIAKGEDIRWMLLVEGSVNAPVRFEGVKCVQQWTLKMQLDKMYPLDDEEAENNFFNTFQGKYYGMLEAEAVYNLSNYDSQYLLKEGESLIMADTDKVRLMINVWAQYCKKVGIPYELSQKRSQAVCSYKIPVLVTLDPGREPGNYIYGSTKYFLGEEELESGEKPKPEIDVDLQIFRKFKVDAVLSNEPNSRIQVGGHEYVSGDVIYKGFGNLFDATTKPQHEMDVIINAMVKGMTFQTINDSTRVDYSEFSTMPNGTLQINLRESIADESTSW